MYQFDSPLLLLAPVEYDICTHQVEHPQPRNADKCTLFHYKSRKNLTISTHIYERAT